MAILTVEELRDHLTSPLEDDAIQRLLDGAEEEIVRFAGGASGVEVFPGGYPFIVLARPAASITSIVELEPWSGDTLTLSADDWFIHPSGYRIDRLRTGTNPRSHWRRGRVTVTYTPGADDAIRENVQLDLVNLMLSYAPGMTSEQIGAWMEQRSNNESWNASDERLSILARLKDGPYIAVVGG